MKEMCEIPVLSTSTLLFCNITAYTEHYENHMSFNNHLTYDKEDGAVARKKIERTNILMVLFTHWINPLVEEEIRGGAVERLEKEDFVLLQTDK